jgi:hypothetical protein
VRRSGANGIESDSHRRKGVSGGSGKNFFIFIFLEKQLDTCSFFVDLLSFFEWKFNGRSLPNRLFAPFSVHGAASPCEC